MDKQASLTKAPQKKTKESISTKPKQNLSQSINSPMEQIQHLQQTMGNQTVQRLIKSGKIKAKLKIGQHNDKYEQEADRIADKVMSMPEPNVRRQPEEEKEEDTPLVQQQTEEEETIQSKGAIPQPQTVPSFIESRIQSLKDGGEPLPGSSRSFFESRFGRDFSRVRLHTDSEAAEAAKSVNAKALTTGRDVFFGAGHYSPGTSTGKRLLAHELTHTIQQSNSNAGYDPVIPGKKNESIGLMTKSEPLNASIRNRSNSPLIQFDLLAYNKPRLFVAPTILIGPLPSPRVSFEITAEAPGIRSALSGLIAANKVKEVKSKSGRKSWFAANHHKNAKLANIKQAFKRARYSRAYNMARCLYDIHGEYLYNRKRITHFFFLFKISNKGAPRITIMRERSLTEYEIRQAKRVFKNAINYSKVTVADGSVKARILTVGGYARVVGNTMYFPTGTSRNMAYMIHELTHIWQYQKKGWSYAHKCILAQVAGGYKYAPKGKKQDQALREARRAGKTLYDYNYEQQGDILSDYFKRLQKGKDVSAYQPFVNDVK